MSQNFEDGSAPFGDNIKDLKAGKDLKDLKEFKDLKKSKVEKDKVIKDDSKKKQKNKKKKREFKFDTFIHRVLRQVHPQINITRQGMTVMNDLVCNAFIQVAEEAGRLVKLDNRDTLHARDVNASVRLVLPGELAGHSNDEGEAALHHFEQFQKTKNQQNL